MKSNNVVSTCLFRSERKRSTSFTQFYIVLLHISNRVGVWILMLSPSPLAKVCCCCCCCWGSNRPPNSPYGPSLIIGMAHECFSTQSGNYEYTLCMFRNVTQKKVSDPKSRVTVGIWEAWEVRVIAINSFFLFGLGCGAEDDVKLSCIPCYLVCVYVCLYGPMDGCNMY